MTRLNVLFKNFSQCRKIAQNSYATGREMGLLFLMTNSNLIVFKKNLHSFGIQTELCLVLEQTEIVSTDKLRLVQPANIDQIFSEYQEVMKTYN